MHMHAKRNNGFETFCRFAKNKHVNEHLLEEKKNFLIIWWCYKDWLTS